MEVIQILANHSSLLWRNILKPARQGFIVVGSCIYHTVVRVIMGQIVAAVSGITLVKSKLNYFHIRISAVLHQLHYRVCHKAQILRDNVLFSKTVFNGIKKLHTRTFFPPAVLCCFIAERNRIIFVKAAEMVDSDNIIHSEAVTDSANPPLETGLFMYFPVVQRISPELSCCRKSVRRASCDLCRLIILIDFKEPRTRPGVCTVHCHINRNISNDSDSVLICVGF